MSRYNKRKKTSLEQLRSIDPNSVVRELYDESSGEWIKIKGPQRIFKQSTEPSSEYANEGDIWIDTSS